MYISKYIFIWKSNFDKHQIKWFYLVNSVAKLCQGIPIVIYNQTFTVIHKLL